MKLKLLALPLILSLPHLSSAAVGPEDFTVGESDANAPSAKFQLSDTSKMDFDSTAGGYSLSRVTLDTPLGGLIHLNDSSAVSVGLSYEGTRLESDTLLGNTDLHELRVSATWYYHASGSKWSFLAGVAPGVATDFEQFTSDDFSLNWKVGVRYAFTDRLAFVAGLGVGNSTGDDDIFPSVGFQWQATNDIYVTLVGSSFSTTWQPCDDWLLRVGVWAAGGVWNAENSGSSLDVKLTSYRAAVGVEHRLRDNTWLTLWAGATISNELDIETSGGTKVFRDDADTGWFVNLGIRVAAW